MRIVSAADAERRRVEHALHDGVQQDLIAVLVRLQLARRVAETDPSAKEETLDEIATHVRETLERVGALGNGIYPSFLEAGGLAGSIRHLLLAAGVDGAVDEQALEPRCLEAEAALYFYCRALVEAVSANPNRGERLRIEIRKTKHELELRVHAESVTRAGSTRGLDDARDRIVGLGGKVSYGSDGLLLVVPVSNDAPTER